MPQEKKGIHVFNHGSFSSLKANYSKRRLYCKLQLWMWRKRRERCHFRILRAKKRAHRISSGSFLSVRTQSQKNKSKVESPLRCNIGDSGDTLTRQHCPLKRCKSVNPSERFIASSSLQTFATDAGVSAGNLTMPVTTVTSQKAESLRQLREMTDPLRCYHTVEPMLSTDSDACGSSTHFKEPRTMGGLPAKRTEVDSPSGQLIAVPSVQDQAGNRENNKTTTSKKMSSQTEAGLKVQTKDIREFLDDFYSKYGSFIPLQKSDVLLHLKRKFNMDFSDTKNTIFSEVNKYRNVITQKHGPSFLVAYKKHTLTLDDLLTLADQNWLNDQVINMYGDLIMESAHHKVHFLNSFFHRQLMTKGYDGVKRWTKQIDLFSKSLLLVPVHLEVHWCLVTADMVKKKICLYDSQGNALQKVARNILKYLMTEAKEKKQTAFENGWAVSFDEKIPQQTNENDCGVFVLEYSRCLALDKPLLFSQKDIPKIRKRIYKELCDCKLYERG